MAYEYIDALWENSNLPGPKPSNFHLFERDEPKTTTKTPYWLLGNILHLDSINETRMKLHSLDFSFLSALETM